MIKIAVTLNIAPLMSYHVLMMYGIEYMKYIVDWYVN
jgi:hypothetical protein